MSKYFPLLFVVWRPIVHLPTVAVRNSGSNLVLDSAHNAFPSLLLALCSSALRTYAAPLFCDEELISSALVLNNSCVADALSGDCSVAQEVVALPGQLSACPPVTGHTYSS